MCNRTQEKGAATPQETEARLPLSVQESLAEVWIYSGLPQGQGRRIQQCWEPGVMEVAITPLLLPQSGLSPTTVREHSTTQPQKIGLKIH